MPPVKKPKHRRNKTFMKAWREKVDISQDTAADRVGVDRSTLSRIERGDLPYNQDFLERLAVAYGCEVDDLLNNDPKKPDPPRLIYQRLRRAPPDVQDLALRLLETLLKAG